MNEEQIRRLVLQALADLTGDSATATGNGSRGEGPAQEPAGADYPQVVTQAEVQAALTAGRKRLAVGPSTLVTPLARDLAQERGLEIVVGTATGSANATAMTGCVSGSSYCIECEACLQPAFYERRPWPLAGDLSALVQRVQAFTADVWPAEPADVRALREVRKPPMGNLPCVVYANANLFWSGENIQIARELAKSGALPVDYLNRHLAATLTRHAARLSKWGFSDTTGLLADVISFLEQSGVRDAPSFTYLCEQLMIALDRVQSWTDRMIPWNDLDAGVALRPVM